jgi:squalene synthase HpnC
MIAADTSRDVAGTRMRAAGIDRRRPSASEAGTMDAAFAEHLRTWGPDRTDARPPSVAEAEAYCRRLATSHYENFPLATWLLPRRLHRHFHNVYAFCRWADDLGDEVGDPARSLQLLGWWRRELQACAAGEATHPVFVALRGTMTEFRIPTEPFADLISAFEQDQHVREYATIDDLRDYCRRSADPVGRIVLHLIGAHDGPNVAWSDSICTGLQLANFWQDVARDADIGRTYLPRADRERFGYADADLAARATTPAFLELMRFEVDRARELLEAGLPLVDRLRGRVQVDIELFARGGLCLLERIGRIGYRVWDRRPQVTKGDVARLFAGCTLRAVGRGTKRSFGRA